MRRLALKSVLSQKVLDESLVVVDEFKFETPKTKDFAQSLGNLNVDKKALLVLEEDNESAVLAARNLSNVKIVEPEGINVLDIMNSDKLVITQKALSQVEEALA
jgi:large subunit ribosomal protein L4